MGTAVSERIAAVGKGRRVAGAAAGVGNAHTSENRERSRHRGSAGRGPAGRRTRNNGAIPSGRPSRRDPKGLADVEHPEREWPKTRVIAARKHAVGTARQQRNETSPAVALFAENRKQGHRVDAAPPAPGLRGIGRYRHLKTFSQISNADSENFRDQGRGPALTPPQMQVSKRFLVLLDQQLAQFTDRPDLLALVVYLALPGEDGKPSLVPIGQWPHQPTLPADPRPSPGGGTSPSPASDTAQGQARRWLALRDDRLLLGALRVDAEHWPWPRDLGDRLDATARCLTEALRLDLEQQRLGRELDRRDEQLRLLVHQLRNPLAALRTFGQLLLRRLEGDPGNRTLVDQLLGEQRQLNRYVDAIDLLAAPAVEPAAPSGALMVAAPEGARLLLPAGLAGETPSRCRPSSRRCWSGPAPPPACRDGPGTAPPPYPAGGAMAAPWARSWPICSRTPSATAPPAPPWGCTAARRTAAHPRAGHPGELRRG